MKLLIDTNVLIDFLRGHEKATEFLASNKDSLLISTITVAELYSGLKGKEEEGLLQELLNSLQIIPVSSSIAQQGGLYKNEYQRSHGVGIADAVIAATAVQEDAKFITLNTKHFPMLEEISSPY